MQHCRIAHWNVIYCIYLLVFFVGQTLNDENAGCIKDPINYPAELLCIVDIMNNNFEIKTTFMIHKTKADPKTSQHTGNTWCSGDSEWTDVGALQQVECVDDEKRGDGSAERTHLRGDAAQQQRAVTSQVLENHRQRDLCTRKHGSHQNWTGNLKNKSSISVNIDKLWSLTEITQLTTKSTPIDSCCSGGLGLAVAR